MSNSQDDDAEWMPMWVWWVIFLFATQLWIVLILFRFGGSVIQAAIVALVSVFAFWLIITAFTPMEEPAWHTATAVEVGSSTHVKDVAK